MMSRLTQVASFLSLASLGLSITTPSIIPFLADGILDACSTDSTAYNSGGTISVNGWSVKVPKNLIVQFPAAWVPFPKICSLTGSEVSISGNVVNGQAIAAQINLAQLLIETGNGYISRVNTDNSVNIVGGPVVRINDPTGVYGQATTGHELFTSDPENPSITAFSGFPMCIPRSATDTKCPASNRPAGQSTFEAPNWKKMAPLRVGDYIEYSGIKVGGEFWAYALTAINVQITTTASDTVPNFIRMEDALIGVFDPDGNVEVADMRFVGYLSSCVAGVGVSIHAIDVDPCTGEESRRQVGTASPRAGDPRCKWEFRADTVAASTYTREYVIVANNPSQTTDDGIEAGEYVQPVTEWIQPEIAVPGAEAVPYRFEGIRGLVQGDFLDGQQFGPLSPFPGPAPPAPSKTCSPNDIPNPASTPTVAPVASIVPFGNTAIRSGVQILLVAHNTKAGIQDSQINWAWTKTSPASPAISITNAASPTATFIAPKVNAVTTFTFRVVLTLKADASKTSTATVTVRIDPNAADTVVVDSFTWASRQSGTLNVNCHSSVVNGDSKGMNLILNGNNNAPVAMTAGAGAGKWVFSNRSTPKPNSVQCVSPSPLNGKSDVLTATTARRRKRGELGGGMGLEMSPAI